MNTHGRVLNRTLLFLLGIAAVVIAAVAAWPVVTGGPVPYVGQGLAFLQDRGASLTVLAWIVAGVLAAGVVVALALILTRPPRRIRAAIDGDGISIDTTVVEGIFENALTETPDVLAVSSSTAVRRGRRTVALKVQLRPRADLAGVIAAVEKALQTTDHHMGVRLPIAVHLTSGIRSTFAHDRRVV